MIHDRQSISHATFMALSLVFALGIVGSQAGAANAPLPDAAEKADCPRARALLKESAEVNSAQPDGMTALHWAAHHDNPEAANVWLPSAADGTASNRYGV